MIGKGFILVSFGDCCPFSCEPLRNSDMVDTFRHVLCQNINITVLDCLPHENPSKLRIVRVDTRYFYLP